jgi:hypothetical protein
LRLFENRVVREIFGHKRDEVTGDWRKLHNEELNDMYCAIIFILVIKSRRLRWERHVARMGGDRYIALQGFGADIRRKEKTWKICVLMEG